MWTKWKFLTKLPFSFIVGVGACIGLGALLAKVVTSDFVFFKVNSGVTFDANKALDKGLETFNQNPHSSLSPIGERLQKALNALTSDVKEVSNTVPMTTFTNSFNWFSLGVALTIFTLALSTCFFAYKYFKLKKSFLSFEASTLQVVRGTRKLVDGVAESHSTVVKTGRIATISLKNMTSGLTRWETELRNTKQDDTAHKTVAEKVIRNNIKIVTTKAAGLVAKEVDNRIKLLPKTAQALYKTNANKFLKSHLPGNSASFNSYKNKPANVLCSCLTAIAIVGLLKYGYADVLRDDFCQYLQTHNFYLPFEQHCITIRDVKWDKPDFINLHTTTVSKKGENIMRSSEKLIDINARWVWKEI